MRVKKMIAGGLTTAMLGAASLLAAAPVSADDGYCPTPPEPGEFVLILQPPGADAPTPPPPSNVSLRVWQEYVEIGDGFFSDHRYHVFEEGTLTWDGLSCIDKYNIYKDGSYLTTVTGTSYGIPPEHSLSARWTVVSVDDDTNRFSPQSSPARRFGSIFS